MMLRCVCKAQDSFAEITAWFAAQVTVSLSTAPNVLFFGDGFFGCSLTQPVIPSITGFRRL